MAVVPYAQGNQLMDMAKRIDTYKSLMRKCEATMREQEQRAIQQERALANIQTKQRTVAIANHFQDESEKIRMQKLEE